MEENKTEPTVLLNGNTFLVSLSKYQNTKTNVLDALDMETKERVFRFSINVPDQEMAPDEVILEEPETRDIVTPLLDASIITGKIRGIMINDFWLPVYRVNLSRFLQQQEAIDTNEDLPEVRYVEMTCTACPESYQGSLDDGRLFAARNRHGHFTIHVSKEPSGKIKDAFEGIELFSAKVPEAMSFDLGIVKELVERAVLAFDCQ